LEVVEILPVMVATVILLMSLLAKEAGVKPMAILALLEVEKLVTEAVMAVMAVTLAVAVERGAILVMVVTGVVMLLLLVLEAVQVVVATTAIPEAVQVVVA
jgi:hypothetical protein